MSPKVTILVIAAAVVAALAVFRLTTRDVTQGEYSRHLIERETGAKP
jgi:hypothetical protein